MYRIPSVFLLFVRMRTVTVQVNWHWATALPSPVLAPTWYKLTKAQALPIGDWEKPAPSGGAALGS